MSEPTPPARTRRWFGIVLTFAVAIAWTAVVAQSAERALWPRADLARSAQTFGPLAAFALIVGCGLVGLTRRGRDGDLVGYALAVGVLWLIHADLAEPAPSRHTTTEPPAILREIDAAQTLFRERDLEGDMTLDYGTLTELVDQGLIDEFTSKHLARDQPLAGYRYRVLLDPAQSRSTYLAVANPVELDLLSPEPRHAIAYAGSPGRIVLGLAPLTLTLGAGTPPNTIDHPASPAPLLAERPVARNTFWRDEAPFGPRGTLLAALIALATLGAWVLRLRPFRPYPGSVAEPGEDDVPA